MFAWALAKADYPADGFYEALSGVLPSRADEFAKTSHALASLSTALHMSGRASPEVLDWLGTVLDRPAQKASAQKASAQKASALSSFSPHSLVSVATPFALSPVPLSDRSERILDAIATHSIPRLTAFDPASLASLARVYARAASNRRIEPPTALLNAVAAAALPMLPRFGPRDLPTLAWAFARGRVPPPETLLDPLAEAAVLRVGEMPRETLTTLAWSYGQLLGSAHSDTVGESAPAPSLSTAVVEMLDALGEELSGRRAQLTQVEDGCVEESFRRLGRPSPFGDSGGAVPGRAAYNEDDARPIF